MMKLSVSRCVFISVLIAAGFLNLAEVADAANEFRKCYNTSVEMHCFDLQYDTTNNRWLYASFEDARQRCTNLNSTLLIIKDEETNNFVNSYISDPSNPMRNQNVWTDAYRVNDYSNSYVWHWLNSKLPTLTESEVGYNVFIHYSDYYTATIECRSDNGKTQFYLTAKLPQDSYSYLCEYSVSRCSTNASNALQLSDRCYISFNASVSWYEARNRCLRNGGDLASFANVTNINFTSWLGSDPYVRYWIGLRFTWYIWKESGEIVKFSNWPAGYNDWSLLCLTVCPNCNPIYSWLAKDCNAQDTRVVCHTVTPLPTTTLTTTSTTTLPVTTSADVKSQTETTQSNNPGSNPSRIENISGSPPTGVAVGVGVGVGVGVPVIIAIIVIVICVVRKHKSKTEENTTTRQESREDMSHTEYQNNNSEDSEVNHYAIVHPSSPPKMVQEEPSSEPQYAILGFNDTADRKSDIGHFPLNVL